MIFSMRTLVIINIIINIIIKSIPIIPDIPVDSVGSVNSVSSVIPASTDNLKISVAYEHATDNGNARKVILGDISNDSNVMFKELESLLEKVDFEEQIQLSMFK